MAEQRHVFLLSRSLVVALPAQVRKHLGVGRGDAVYWHLRRGQEAVLALVDARVGGHPEGMTLARKLAAALAEVARLTQRNEARDRTMYAEGYNVGYLHAQERLSAPGGASAERQRRRRVYASTFPEAAREARRAKRRARPRPPARPVEVGEARVFVEPDGTEHVATMPLRMTSSEEAARDFERGAVEVRERD